MNFILILTLALSAGAVEVENSEQQKFCLTQKKNIIDNSPHQGYEFADWDELLPIQQYLLGTYLRLNTPRLSNQNIRNVYQVWTKNQNSHLTAFLAITNALKRTQIWIDQNNQIDALSLVVKINDLWGDRIKVVLDHNLFALWQNQNGRFLTNWENGKIETGNVVFRDHGTVTGSLHCGYDIQGYTHGTRVPRLQWNVRNADMEADIDIDGIAPYLAGFIPNPAHLTYKNSDVRAWLAKYQKKFGDPGFKIQKSEVFVEIKR